MRSRADRGVSPVVAVVLMVAVTVILAAAVGSFALQFTDAKQDPAPQVANADGSLVKISGSNTDQTVRITHEGGDTVTVADLEIVVSFSNSSKRSRLVGAPTTTIDAADYEGDDVWDHSNDGIEGALAPDTDAGDDGQWSSGESIAFRIPKSDVELYAGDTVTVTVVHAPTGSIIVERVLTAELEALAPLDHADTDHEYPSATTDSATAQSASTRSATAPSASTDSATAQSASTRSATAPSASMAVAGPVGATDAGVVLRSPI